jgi:hypothetical protein
MTAVTSPQFTTTSLDRALLGTASALDRFVAARMQRRALTAPSAVEARHDSTRRTAQALGAIGILPR